MKIEIEKLFRELKRFVGKYIPVISDFELDDLEMEILKARESLRLEKSEDEMEKESWNKFGYLLTIYQSNAQDRDEGEAYSYYSRIIEDIILSSTLSDFKAKKTILSIGAGLALTELFSARELFPNSYIVCLDFAENMCKKSRKIAIHEGTNNIDFIIADARRLPFKNRKFDHIWLIGELSFNRHTIGYQGTLMQFIKPSGKIISISA